MNNIKKMSDNLASRISAGEVISTPSSVVKELIENAIDAAATKIVISIKDGGLTEISVTDNGTGVSKNDLPLTVMNNATSKLIDENDLFNIRTLGFRGEALASISAISKLSISSATESGLGYLISSIEGNISDIETVSHPKGTTVTVSQLFYATPSRIQFLKSQQIENSRTAEVVNRFILSHPEIGFELKNDGKSIIRTRPTNDLIDTLSHVYGHRIGQDLVKIEAYDDDFEISGAVSLPKQTKANRNNISVVINGRYINNQDISRAIVEGYSTKLMVGRYPIALINIKTDAQMVDANVHPGKQEVRISKLDQLIELVRKTISKQLSENTLIPQALENVESEFADSSVFENDFLAEKVADFSQEVTADTVPDPIDINDLTSFVSDDTHSKTPILDTVPVESENVELISKPTANSFPNLTYIGQVHGTYLLTESPDGLYLVDQHAAHERINFEFYRKHVAEIEQYKEPLLVPIIKEMSTSESFLVESKLDIFHEFGIDINKFGDQSFAISAVPNWVGQNRAKATIDELIDYVTENRKTSLEDFRLAAAKMISCKSAIKANHHLEPDQAKKLLADLSNAKNPYNCPHGRPTLVKFSNNELERMFKRIQDSHDSLRQQF